MTRFAAVLLTALALAACATEPPPAAVRSLPAAGGVAAAPLTLVRVWFNEATVLAQTEITLEGPGGSIPLIGTHSMGEGDLMASVGGPTPAGDYALTWTATGSGGATANGVVDFAVVADQPAAAPEDPPLESAAPATDR